MPALRGKEPAQAVATSFVGRAGSAGRQHRPVVAPWRPYFMRTTAPYIRLDDLDDPCSCRSCPYAARTKSVALHAISAPDFCPICLHPHHTRQGLVRPAPMGAAALLGGGQPPPPAKAMFDVHRLPQLLHPSELWGPHVAVAPRAPTACSSSSSLSRQSALPVSCGPDVPRMRAESQEHQPFTLSGTS